jgi:DNA-binding NarL/FixJ family response regulator
VSNRALDVGSDQSLSSEALTVREQQVMMLAAFGLSTKAIARQLHLSCGTVRLYLHRIYRKLGVKNRTGAVAAMLKGSNSVAAV